ncbi:MAG TPA: hypothetical protein VE359_24235 [Vicinamibacteria bacterium]|jgi:hypothetical protein|nr:hypothetical protein [Vicinamibacteria bacterium]
MSAGATTPAGCLTDAQLAQLQAAVPGRAPEASARHLASCGRCQARALFGAERVGGGPKKARREPPSLGRALLLAAVVLAAMGAFFWTLLRLTGRIE